MSSIVVIKKNFKHLETIQGDEYYKLADIICDQFRDWIRTYKLADLSKKDLLMMCSIASALRPYQPHIFLSYLSSAYKGE